MVSDKVFNTDGTQKIFSSDFDIISEDHLRVYLGAAVVSRDDYDLINNAAVFNVAPTTGQVMTVQVGTTPADILVSPTDAGIVAANIADINALEDIIGDIVSVSTNNADVTTVANNIASVNTTATNIADVTAVADNETNINVVGTNIANVNTTATNIASVNTVAGNAANVNTVAGISANVTTVAGISADVTAAATNAADITAVATEVAKVVEVANDLQEAISEIDTVATSIANVDLVGGSITNVNEVATNIGSVNAFGEQYRVSATEPTTSLDAGDLWFDTTSGTMKVYGSLGWQNAGSSVNGIENSVEHIATAGQTSFAAVYDAGNLNVFLNGVKLDSTDYTATDGSNVVLDTGATVGDSVFVQSFGTFELADHYTKAVSDARYLQLTGGTVTGDVTATDFIGPLNGAIQFTAKNRSGGTINKGQAIYISGISGNTPEIGLADANNASTMPAFGLAGSTATDNNNLEVVTFGSIHGVQTNYTGWALGDTLYISTTAGTLTNVAPSGEAAQIQNIGTVERLHSSNGTIKVGGAGRTNATPNLNDGNVFIGNASNKAVSVALSTVALSPTGDGSQLTGIDALPSQATHAGKYLGTDGSTASWNTLDTDANSTTKGLYEHANTIAANYTIATGNNALTAGPITINTGVSVTVPTGSTWVIA